MRGSKAITDRLGGQSMKNPARPLRRMFQYAAEFWQVLGRLMPDYEHRKAALKAMGPRLEW
jgi:hypothetical protein